MPDILRVLYVDDEPDLLEIGKLFLEESGDFTVTTVNNAPDAIRLLEQEQFDAIISDYQMPGMDGIQLLIKVREKFGQIPFILFTGKGREEVVIQAINSGVDFYIQKGGGPEPQFAELVHKTRSAVSSKKAAEALRISEEKYRQLIEHANEVIVVAQDGMLKLVNQRAIEVTGYSEQELLSMPFSDIINPADRAVVVERYMKRLKGVELLPLYPFRVGSKDGNTRWVELSAVVIDWDGRPATLNFLSDVTERKKAEEALSESEEKFRLITETIDEAFWMADIEIGKIFYVSPSFEHIWGRSRESLYKNPRSFIDAIHMEDRERILASLEIQKSGLPFDVEYRILHPDGNIRHIWHRGYPIRDERGLVSRYVGVAMDVTERKRTERVLAERDELFRSVVYNSSDLTILTDANGSVTYVSPQCERVLGYPAEKILGQIVPDFIHPEDIARCRESWGQVAHQGLKVYEFEYRIIDGQGAVRWVSHSASQTVANGRVLGMQNTIRDITERKRTEIALLENEEKYRGIFDESIAAVYVFDDKKKFINSNQAGLDLLGYSREELLHMSIPDVDADPVVVLPAHQELLSGGRLVNYEHSLRRKDGTVIMVLNSSSPLKDLHGNVVGMISTLIDITERKKADELLRISEEKYRKAFFTSPDSICITRLQDGMFVSVNKGFTEISGYTEEDVEGKTSLEINIWKDPEDRRKIVEGTKAHGEVRDYEARFLTKTGEIYGVMSTSIIEINGVPHILNITRDITGRKRAEELVRESENKFSAIFNGSPVALTLSSATDGKFVNVNDAFIRATGYTRDEVIGTTPEALGIFADNERERLAASLRDHHVVEDMEISCLTKTREIRPCLFSSGIILIGGKPHILSSVSDNRARKKAEEDLRDSEMLFREIFDKANDAIFLVEQSPDGPGRYTLVNERATQILGYSREEFLEMSPRDIVPGGNQKKFFQDVTEKIEKNGGAIFESAQRRKDGIILPIETSIHRFLYKGRDVDLSIVRDITERKRAEKALKESEAQYHLLADNVHDVIWTVDKDMHMTYISPSVMTLRGLTPEEAMAESSCEALTPESYRVLQQSHKQGQDARRTKGLVPASQVLELEFRCKDGSTVWAEMVTTPTFDHNGEFTGLAGVTRDITRRRMTERALRDANKKLNLLSGITRHDISNQLTVLMGYIRILEKKQPDTPHNEYFQKIATAAQRISSMIKFTKEYQEIGVHAPVWQDTRKLVDTAAKQAPLGEVIVNNDLPIGAEVYADPLIVKVFYNLMDNAVNYGGKITTIRFSVEETGNGHMIVCEDDGDGVVAEEKEKIFERGFGKNTGMGLALSREILDITGISIRETGEPGKGTRFEMVVPKGMFR